MKFWNRTPTSLRERAAEMGGTRRRGSSGANCHRERLAFQVHPPLPSEKLFGLGIAGESWAKQFTTGFASIAAALEAGV